MAIIKLYKNLLFPPFASPFMTFVNKYTILSYAMLLDPGVISRGSKYSLRSVFMGEGKSTRTGTKLNEE